EAGHLAPREPPPCRARGDGGAREPDPEADTERGDAGGRRSALTASRSTGPGPVDDPVEIRWSARRAGRRPRKRFAPTRVESMPELTRPMDLIAYASRGLAPRRVPPCHAHVARGHPRCSRRDHRAARLLLHTGARRSARGH